VMLARPLLDPRSDLVVLREVAAGFSNASAQQRLKLRAGDRRLRALSVSGSRRVRLCWSDVGMCCGAGGSSDRAR